MNIRTYGDIAIRDCNEVDERIVLAAGAGFVLYPGRNSVICWSRDGETYFTLDAAAQVAREEQNALFDADLTDTQWERKDLPDRYPPYQICHRRCQEWINLEPDQGGYLP